jgi:hypothetical protein
MRESCSNEFSGRLTGLPRSNNIEGPDHSGPNMIPIRDGAKTYLINPTLEGRTSTVIFLILTWCKLLDSFATSEHGDCA